MLLGGADEQLWVRLYDMIITDSILDMNNINSHLFILQSFAVLLHFESQIRPRPNLIVIGRPTSSETATADEDL